MQQLNVETFNEFIKEGKVLVLFGSEHCPPCKLMLPTMIELSKQHPKVKIALYEVDIIVEEPVQKYSPLGVPTLILLNDGIVLEKWGGRQTFETLNSVLNSIEE